jgi:uncharacterized membrane protein YjjP (DUF1212 family)
MFTLCCLFVALLLVIGLVIYFMLNKLGGIKIKYTKEDIDNNFWLGAISGAVVSLVAFLLGKIIGGVI